MSFSYKKIVFWAFTGLVFLILPINPVNAGTLTTWQNMVSNSTSSLYWFDASDTFLNLGYETDLNGFYYWHNGTNTPDLHYVYLKGFSTSTPNWNYSITIPTDSEGYKFWILQKGGDISDRIFRYFSGGSPYYGYCTLIKNITLADKTLQLTRCSGVSQNPITNVYVSMGAYSTIEDIYLLVYTDDNLDTLIYDQTSMYAYLDNLNNYNALYGGYSSTTPITLPAGTCDNLNIFAGALCKVITFLFVPSSTSLNQFSNLKDIVATKPPFGYFTSIKNYLGSLSNTTTPAFVLTAEIENITIFDTLKTALAWILWLFFAFWVIKRIGRFDF